MRILTVRAPWAQLIMNHGKNVENRVRNIAGGYRGPIALHVGLRPERPGHAWGAADAAGMNTDRYDGEELHLGHIIGVVDVTDVHTADDCYQASIDRAIHLYGTDLEVYEKLPDSGAGGIIGKAVFCSPWAMDEHHHMVFENPRPLAEPIPYKGALGLRRLDEATIAAINEVLDGARTS